MRFFLYFIFLFFRRILGLFGRVSNGLAACAHFGWQVSAARAGMPVARVFPRPGLFLWRAQLPACMPALPAFTIFFLISLFFLARRWKSYEVGVYTRLRMHASWARIWWSWLSGFPAFLSASERPHLLYTGWVFRGRLICLYAWEYAGIYIYSRCMYVCRSIEEDRFLAE